MILAEELALVAVRPDTGRHALGMRAHLNACLAGLLVAELVLDGMATGGPGQEGITVTRTAPSKPMLAAAAQVAAEKGPKIRSILAGMDRGLQQHVGHGTWDAVVSGLTAAGVLSLVDGGLRPSHTLIDARARDEVVARLRVAAGGDGALELRTALVLSLIGPANLLEVVAPERGDFRRHARQRIDHALHATSFEPIGRAVRRLVSEAQVMAPVA